MSKEQLSRQLPDVVDARKMADQQIELEGFVPVEQLQRLDPLTREHGGAINVVASFRRDESYHRWLRINARGSLMIECQRCLSGYKYESIVDCDVMLVNDDDIAKQVPRHVEPVVLDDDMVSIWEVLVDEILLTLPAVSEHDPQQCSGKSSFEFGPGEADQEVEAPTVENPFSVLAKLKSGKAD